MDLSEDHLSQVINVHSGENYYNLINYYRVEEAKRLLTSQPDRSIVDIALEVGFNSQSAFYVHFKKNTAMTPLAFRKQSLGRNIGGGRNIGHPKIRRSKK